MVQIDIIVDDREQKVIPYFNKYEMPPNINFTVARVNHGDYSILYKENILFVIERKTWKDLAASLLDGRKENNNKLIKIRSETGCKLIYLIEGNPIPKSDTKFNRIPYKSLRSHLDHLAFRDNIHMVYSRDVENTVERIVEIIQNYLTINPSPLLEFDTVDEVTKISGLDKLKEKVPITAECIIHKIWCSVPFISEALADIFINSGYHISDIILGIISKEEIYTMKYKGGTSVGKKSEKIWKNTRLDCTSTFVKMLTQLNGITKKTAIIILTSISFENLLKGKVLCQEIADIVKSDSGRKIGVKVSSEIIKYFVNLKPDLNPDLNPDLKIDLKIDLIKNTIVA